MSFIVRQIALKSDGGEIVRSNTVAETSITVGRNSENAVHLADLAVDPVHARLTLESDGRISVTSESGLKFELDGRSVSSGMIDPAKGGELGFGGHLITVAREADVAEPVLTVRRVDAVSDSAEDKDLGAVYTLKGLLPGKRISAWGFLLLVLAACLAWPIYTWSQYKDVKERPAGFHADTMWTSGKLSLAHKSLENDCQSCHVEPFVAVTDESCMTCHKDDAHDHAPKDRILNARAAPTGFAKFQRDVATQFNRPAGRCVECHTEHEGAGAMQPTQQRFCTECHDGLDTRLTDTKIANAADFGTDHPQFNPMIMVNPAGPDGKPVFRRVSLDSNPKEINGLKFPHDVHLSQTNGVAQMGRRLGARYGFGASLDCANCHKEDPSGVWFEPVDMEESCQMCHSLSLERVGNTVRTLRHGEPQLVKADLIAYYRSTPPTRPINLGGMSRRRPGEANAQRTAADYARAVRFRPSRADEAIRAVFSEGGACYDCHAVTGGQGGSLNFGIQPVAQTSRYLHKGWFSHEPHAKEECSTCHAAKSSDQATDLLIPGIKVCRDCHVGEGGASLFSITKPVESTCAMCHEYHADGGEPWVAREKDKPKKGSSRAKTVALLERRP